MKENNFDSIQPSATKSISTSAGSGKLGFLEDGTKIHVRPGSKTSVPTIDIDIPGKKPIKIRYEEDKEDNYHDTKRNE